MYPKSRRAKYTTNSIEALGGGGKFDRFFRLETLNRGFRSRSSVETGTGTVDVLNPKTTLNPKP